jgi:hypothetical protein
VNSAARPSRGALVTRAVPVALWLAAALISGFTIRRHLEPFDEGLLLQAATRMAEGQWPYADFGWAYGPGQPLVNLAAFELFGPSVLWWRLVRVAADATITLLVWTLVRREAGPRWAVVAWLAAAVTIAQPTSANPVPITLAFALAAVAVAAPTTRRAAAAGVLAALAAFWRPDFGVVAALAVAATELRRGSDPSVVPQMRSVVAQRGLTPLMVAAALGAAVLYAPFAVAAGPGRLWDSLLAAGVRDGAAWRLPFPLEYGGALRGWPPGALAEDVKDVLGFYLPLIGVAGLALVLVLVLARRRVTPTVAGLAVLALGALAYLLSRADELHAQPLLVVLCALVPIVAARLERPHLVVVPLALILLAGVANRVSALVLPPDVEPVHVPGVPGIRVPPAEAAALPQLLAAVQRRVPEGEPVYVAPRRSDLVTLTAPLVHFLVRRPNVLRRDALLQARPEEQERIVAALRRERPRVVIRWLDPISARPEPNERGRPSGSRALDEYLAATYEPDARYGAYEILVPR